MSDGFNETPVRGKRLHNSSVSDSTAVATLPAIAGTAPPAFTEGNVVALSTDLAGNLRVTLSDPNGFDVDITDRAARLLGVVSLDAASLGALENTTVTLDAATLAALEDVGLNAATRDDIVTRLTTAIEASHATTRAALESVDLNAATLSALESVSINPGSSIDVTDRAGRIVGVVTLDAASLAALESVDLNAASLAALETTELGATTLAALETTDLGPTTLAALESIDLNAATITSIRDVSDRAARALGVVDVNDRTARVLGQLTTRGAVVSDTNPLAVMLQENPGTLFDSGLLTTVDLAPGASTTLTGTAVGASLTGKLLEFTASSSVRIRVALRANGVVRRVFFFDPLAGPFVYAPRDRDMHTVAATQAFSVVITNLDNLRTADVYASLSHIEV